MEHVDNKATVVSTHDRDNFISDGPSHLNVVDWDNEHHRRSVAASLVSGVYNLELDRHDNRNSQEALAPPWWEFFNFRLISQLLDDADQSIFGAVFEYELKTSHSDHSNKGIPPHYVIAFRGTLTKKRSRGQDLKLDLKIVSHGLHSTTRMRTASQAVQNVVASSQNRRVWLAGHSLGAAIAVLAGKEMATTGKFLKCFLFNPPFVAAPLDLLKSERVKDGIHIVGSVITAALALFMSVEKSQQKNRSEETFSAISSWVPNLFVHPKDYICSGFIKYFLDREKMKQIGAVALGKLATQHSIGGLVRNVIGKDAETGHLLPSASLTINMAHAPDLFKAHALKQWWKPESEVHLQAFLYQVQP